MSKTTYIISDLHLNQNNTQSLSLFKKFIQSISCHQNLLYILGDFLDYWIGDDGINEFHNEIISVLKKANDSGLIIYFMKGNRDFLIGTNFAKMSKIKIISDPHDISYKSKTIRLMHGDLLCTSDTSYQFFRKIVRNKIVQKVYLSLPLKTRRNIAIKARKQSSEKQRKIIKIDVTEKGLNRYTKNCAILIHGHTHQMAKHDHKDFIRYVLGDWHKKGSFIKIDEDINLLDFI